jgi:hypothetical protein
MDYYFTFYCDDLCANLMCTLEFEEADPEVGVKESLSLYSAVIEGHEAVDVFAIMNESLIEEIEQAAKKDLQNADRDYF